MAHPVDTIIEMIYERGLDTLIASSEADLIPCLNAVADVLEQHQVSTQFVSLALLFGVACSSIEGEPCEIEQEGCLITFEERLLLFLAQARVSYHEGMKQRASPDCPPIRKRGVQ